MGDYLAVLVLQVALLIIVAGQADERAHRLTVVALDPDTAVLSTADAPGLAEEDTQWFTFGGYPCENDCSQHEAGYRWAEEHGVTDPANCEGDDARFIEGCRVYAEERQQELGLTALR